MLPVYTVEYRYYQETKTTVMDLRENENLVISTSGSNEEVALAEAKRILKTRVDVGKKSEIALKFLDKYKK